MGSLTILQSVMQLILVKEVMLVFFSGIRIFDVQGIYYAEPVADIVAAVTTGIVFLLMSKKLLKKNSKEKNIR